MESSDITHLDKGPVAHLDVRLLLVAAIIQKMQLVPPAPLFVCAGLTASPVHVIIPEALLLARQEVRPQGSDPCVLIIVIWTILPLAPVARAGQSGGE